MTAAAVLMSGPLVPHGQFMPHGQLVRYGPLMKDGLFDGPGGTLIVLGLPGLAMALVVLVLNGWMRWQRSRQQPVPVDENTVEAAPSFRRYLVAAAWAGGSARDWDHSLRPVLGELVELAMAEHQPGAEPRAAAREMFGADWPLVDREARRSDDRASPGPGHDALLRILDRLEKL